MDDLEQTLQNVLSDPQMMQKIMGLAQSLGGPPPGDTSGPEQGPQQPPMPELDLSMIQKLSGLLGRTGIDTQQKALLNALTPYMSSDRVQKLQRAMQAAKIAELASSLLDGGSIL